ncbi:serine/threonine dehydratase [Aestuariibacter halophilus]|uniref:Serine/threonine dehydratase n=1 Tax=Fluctibacter halophilus TaxID=226011 RepID=A0ABS8GBC4_9ALTE|nr:serine/threonine dehydratase [Aestuariibacter halophilus]MCC2617879.1 serine/threonine dehydratase [Aestuariibacter halophilus]
MPGYDDIRRAQIRVQEHIKQTPIVESHLLNQWLGSRILFKAECLQTTGAFKVRGALNALSAYIERHGKPRQVVANSSGNHAQAVAWAAHNQGIPATIYTTHTVSAVKAAATRHYGAQLCQFSTRVEADEAVQRAAEQDGVFWIPPFNHEDVIAGQGTLALDAFSQLNGLNIDAICTPCGGGGLLSGTLLTTRQHFPTAKVLGAEPANANDAARSLKLGHIVGLEGTANTLADGAATPSVGPLTFPLLQQVDGFYEVEETAIAYWTQWLQHLLKLHIEPTSAMTLEAVARYLQQQGRGQTIMVLISGGNISPQTSQQVWSVDHLQKVPDGPFISSGSC